MMARRSFAAVCVALALALAGTAVSYVLLPFRWPSPRAGLFSGALETAERPDDFRVAFERAAAEWRQKTGFEIDVAPDAVGACTTSGRLLNGAEFFAFDCGGFRLGQRTLAVTETVVAVGETEGEDGEIRVVGITFNSEVNWDVYDGPWRSDAADFQRVALHEQGHVIGLDHEDGQETATIMRSLAGDIAFVQQDDIDGVRARYAELVQNDPPEQPPRDDAPEEPVGLPPLHPPADTPPAVPSAACLAEHLGFAAGFCRNTLACFADRARNPGPVAGCLGNAEASFLESSCTTPAWAAFIGDTLAQVDAGIGAGIDPSEKKEQRLQAKLLKLAGKHCAKAMAAESKNAKKPNAGKLAAKRSKARSRAIGKSNKAIAKNERKGFPYDGPSGRAIADGIDALVDAAMGR